MKHIVDNKNRKIIGFDMDGVIIDYTRRKIELAKSLGFKIKKDQTSSEIIKKLISPLSVYRDFQYILYEKPASVFSSPLMPGVKPVLKKLTRSGIPYFLISKRKRPEIARAILVRHGLWPRYFNRKNTFFVAGSKDKETKAKELGITHYIDDEQKVLQELVSVRNKYLFDLSGTFKNTPYTVISSWKEISGLI